MRNLSFSTKKNLFGLFAWVWIKAHFSLESAFINLIYKSSFNSFAEVSAFSI